ncbi:MAG: HD domain-containing protein [Oscillospiraceae bacterium]|nr:HD domain-containing protein [Oscillospiraceae bacterium]MBQ8012711.1 HD domain-containing protein [Oscillospiraceae bacterium]MBQ9111184.1 HD domain-containing protein [Oscillospiraceae bacterium]
MNHERFEQQIAFLLELDKLKNIYRQTLVLHEDRQENDAEHSFHLAIMAAILAEHANEKVDVLHVMKMVLVHDVVEIDAGDTYCYDAKGNEDKLERELKAADRLFALLPEEQEREFRGLWEEFEAKATPEAKFANALDRIQPMLLNYKKGGVSWMKHGISEDQVRNRNIPTVSAGSDMIGKFAEEIIRAAKEEGYLK